MLRAVLLVARWIAVAHDHWRAEVARRRPLAAEVDLLRERLAQRDAVIELLQARLRRLPHQHRPRYRPWERLRILWLAARHTLSHRATARAFVLSAQTVLNWHRDILSQATRLVQAKAPLNRLPDLIADLARRLKREWPRWGTRRIAGILARLGLRASRSTVQRMIRRGGRPAKVSHAVRARRGPLFAKRPNHVWVIDFTRVGGLLRSVWVGAIIDGLSRRVLAIGVAARPSASFALRLLRDAVRDGQAPRWMVSDRGREFTAHSFGRALSRRGIRRRYGAVGRSGSIALIERFWGSCKREYANGLFLYRPLHRIESDLRSYAAWFNQERGHQGLGLLTPDEVHGRRSTRPRSVPLHAALEVCHLDGDRQLPVLRLRPAA